LARPNVAADNERQRSAAEGGLENSGVHAGRLGGCPKSGKPRQENGKIFLAGAVAGLSHTGHRGHRVFASHFSVCSVNSEAKLCGKIMGRPPSDGLRSSPACPVADAASVRTV
jgi:hypothetical protein